VYVTSSVQEAGGQWKKGYRIIGGLKMVLGTYKEALSARSTDKQIQKISQDGGIVTDLLSLALDEKIIDGAVVAGLEKICGSQNQWLL